MVDPDEEFEDLFDYKRVQPLDFVSIDDDSDSYPTHSPKRRKISSKRTTDSKVMVGVEVVDCDDGDDDDEEEDMLLLSPPPMILGGLPKCDSEDSVIKELRKRKEELASFAKSTQDILRPIDEPEEGVGSLLESSSEQAVEKPSVTKPASERAKVVISIQDKGGQKQFRIFMDDKFERLFKMYSEKVNIDRESLVFRFDGEKVDPSSTPASLDMEDEDIIEVDVKSR